MSALDVIKRAVAAAQGDVERVCELVQEELGGQQVYIPVADKSARNEAIKRAFNGVNKLEVCRRFNISEITFYRIIRQ